MTPRELYISLIGLAALCGVPVQAQDSRPAATPVRIGVVLPEAQLGQGNSAQDVGENVRQLVVSYMTGPLLEVVPLQAKIPAQVTAEARQQNCTHVLYTSVKQKKAGKGMLRMLGTAATMMPGLAAMGGAKDAMVASMATQAIAAAADRSAQESAIQSLAQAQAGTVKARDEIALTYQFVALADEQAPLQATLKAVASQNGEDLLRPLVSQVAAKAVNAALSPKP